MQVYYLGEHRSICWFVRYNAKEYSDMSISYDLPKQHRTITGFQKEGGKRVQDNEM